MKTDCSPSKVVFILQYTDHGTMRHINCYRCCVLWKRLAGGGRLWSKLEVKNFVLLDFLTSRSASPPGAKLNKVAQNSHHLRTHRSTKITGQLSIDITTYYHIPTKDPISTAPPSPPRLPTFPSSARQYFQLPPTYPDPHALIIRPPPYGSPPSLRLRKINFSDPNHWISSFCANIVKRVVSQRYLPGSRVCKVVKKAKEISGINEMKVRGEGDIKKNTAFWATASKLFLF